MARRKKTTRRRRDTSIRLLNVLEAYTYASIITGGILGAGQSPWGFITGKFDLMQTEQVVSKPFTGEEASMVLQGEDLISLSDLAQAPGLALAQMSSNFTANMTTMAIQGIFTSVSFKLGRRLLRRPIASINRSIFKPLALGVKL